MRMAPTGSQIWIFGHQGVALFERNKRCGLVEGSVPLWAGFEVSKAHSLFLLHKIQMENSQSLSPRGRTLKTVCLIFLVCSKQVLTTPIPPLWRYKNPFLVNCNESSHFCKYNCIRRVETKSMGLKKRRRMLLYSYQIHGTGDT